MTTATMHRLTDGNVVWQLIRFALPFLGANLLIFLYGAADVFIVSSFADSAALAATATGAQAIFTVMAVAMGLNLGGTILIGQYFGARRTEDVIQTIGTLFILITGIGIICSILMMGLADAITEWLHTPSAAKIGTEQYIFICGGGMLFSFLYEAGSAVLKGLGDAKTPLKFIAIACIINVILDFIFVGFYHWGAAGAASATVLAQAVSVVLEVLYLKYHRFIFSFRLKNFHFIPDKAKMILKLGIPTAIQHTIVFASFTLMTIAVNQLGVIESAVLGITNRIDGFFIMPALAFSSAISVMVAQNMGAGFVRRAQKAFFVGFLLSLIFAVPAFYLMYQTPERLMQFVSSDSQVIHVGGFFMEAYSPDCLLLALAFCLNGFFNGCGRTTFTMTNNVVSSVVFRAPLILIATDLYAIGLSMPLSTIPQILVSIGYLYGGRWRKSLITKQVV